jgi:hypothetical protein
MVIGRPPVLTGGVKATTAELSPAVADTAVGAPGTPSGTTVVDREDGRPTPPRLAAVTVKVYEIPPLSPVKTIGLVVAVAVAPPGEAVTVYELTGPGGGVKLTLAAPTSAVAETLPGAAGAGGWNVHTAPAPPLSSGPPITALPPSDDSATAEPNEAAPEAPLPVSFVACCTQLVPDRLNAVVVADAHFDDPIVQQIAKAGRQQARRGRRPKAEV